MGMFVYQNRFLLDCLLLDESVGKAGASLIVSYFSTKKQCTRQVCTLNIGRDAHKNPTSLTKSCGAYSKNNHDFKCKCNRDAFAWLATPSRQG